MRLFKIFVILFFTWFTLPIQAENGVSSPYTRYGFGQLSAMETGVNKGMGGAGIGVHNSNQINMLNPASYAAVDTLTFLLDVGMSMSNTRFSEGVARVNSNSATFDYIAMQFRLAPRLGVTIGLTPFSNIGYDFGETKTIQNDDMSKIDATSRYYGLGGLRQVTFGLGYMPIKGLAVGTNLSYVYGEVYHYVYNQYSDASISSRVRQYRSDVSTYNAELGVQYQAVAGKSKFTLGTTYQFGHDIDDKVYVIETMEQINDTISDKGVLSMPSSYGFGLSYSFDERLTIAVDYSLQRYGDVEFFGEKGVNRQRGAFGVEYIPEHFTRKLFRRARYRAGVHYATAHYMVDGKPGPTEYGIVVGIGLPIMNRWNGQSVINISGQYIHVRPNAPGMITENSLRLNIGLSLNETWFNKWRVQ